MEGVFEVSGMDSGPIEQSFSYSMTDCLEVIQVIVTVLYLVNLPKQNLGLSDNPLWVRSSGGWETSHKHLHLRMTHSAQVLVWMHQHPDQCSSITPTQPQVFCRQWVFYMNLNVWIWSQETLLVVSGCGSDISTHNQRVTYSHVSCENFKYYFVVSDLIPQVPFYSKMNVYTKYNVLFILCSSFTSYDIYCMTGMNNYKAQSLHWTATLHHWTKLVCLISTLEPFIALPILHIMYCRILYSRPYNVVLVCKYVVAWLRSKFSAQ